MTEAKWLACADPTPMLQFLKGKVSDRKMRLFAVACCRRMWHIRPTILRGLRDRATIETAEKFADGEALRDELNAIWKGAFRPEVRELAIFSFSAFERLASSVCKRWPQLQAHWVAKKGGPPEAAAAALRAELQAQAVLLRDILGSSFSSASLDPSWRTWNSGTVVQLARAAFDERELPSGHLDTTRLALLADALEDAGCTDPLILGHLRGPGPHVRGCWAVDLLLGKA